MPFTSVPNLVAVESAGNTPPGSPVTNGYYIILDSPTGTWSGNASRIALYNGSSYEYIVPNVPVLLWAKANTTLYLFNTTSSAWTVPSATASGASIPFNDNSALVQNNADNTKKFILSAASISASTTRTFTMPNADTTLVGIDVAQTLTNKTIDASNNTLSNITESMLLLADNTTNNATTSKHGFVPKLPNNATLYYDGTGNFSTPAGTGASLPAPDTTSIVQGSADSTKQLRFEVDGFTTATTRVATFPDANITVVGEASTQTLTNKTLTASSNVLGGVTMTLGSDATGDLYYRNSGGVLTRLPIGANGQVLSVTSGLPAWGSAGSGTVSGSGTTNRMAVWTSSSAIGASGRIREANSRLGLDTTSDPTTSDANIQIRDFPVSGGFTLNYSNWNSTSSAIPIAINTTKDNGGNTIAAPFPVIVLSMSGVSGQSFATTAALSLGRYSSASNQSNGRLSIQVNNGSNDYPVNTLQCYGTGRVGIGNGTITTSGNDAKALFHVGDQLVNSGSSFSTTSWGSVGLVPLLAVWDAQDASNTTTHPPLILGKKGVSAGQEAQRAEFGIGRYESSSNAPRTRLDLRLAHATNESVGVRVASFYSFGGLGLGLANGTNATTDNSEAILQVGIPTDIGSYSVSNWNSSGNRARTLINTPTHNGGTSPASPEPAIILSRSGVSGQAFGNLVELKLSRYENSSNSARSALTIAATHGSGDTSGTDIIEFRSDKSTNMKGQFGAPRTTTNLSGSQTYDLSAGNTVEITLTGNLTLNFSNAKAGFIYTFVLIQGGSGSYTITWNSAFKFNAGTAPTLSTAVGSVDTITFYHNGTNMLELARTLNVS